MLRKLILITMAATTIMTCSLSADWVPSSVTEASGLAGAVIVGEVYNPPRNPQPFMIEEIYLQNATYYKGYGPKTVKISGYSQSSVCGIDAPKSGTKVILFVCKDEKSDGWKLHKYTAHAGQKIWNEQNMEDLQKALGGANSSNSESYVYKACRDRPKDFYKPRSMVSPNPPVMTAPEPVPQREVIPVQNPPANQRTPIKINNIFEDLPDVRSAVNQQLANAANDQLTQEVESNFRDLGNGVKSRISNIPINFNSFFGGLNNS